MMIFISIVTVAVIMFLFGLMAGYMFYTADEHAEEEYMFHITCRNMHSIAFGEENALNCLLCRAGITGDNYKLHRIGYNEIESWYSIADSAESNLCETLRFEIEDTFKGKIYNFSITCEKGH